MWIFTIAKNESLSWIRKYNKEIPSEDTYLEILGSFEVAVIVLEDNL
ncbi:hypothetical protein [Clostridium sp.]|jgi:RNA polymerase sigma-70 factor (ECF subfamily)